MQGEVVLLDIVEFEAAKSEKIKNSENGSNGQTRSTGDSMDSH